MRALVALAVGAATVLLWSVPASAHASFVRASPGPGSGLAQAPGEVVIRFTEPLVHDLSSIEVVDREGDDVTRGPTAPVEGDPEAMRRPLELLEPGSYEVRWTTVSPLDGHTLKGRYSFAVGTSAAPVDSVDEGPVDSEGWLGLAGRFAALGGLTLWAGHALLAGVARRAGVSERRLRVVGRAAPAAVASGTVASLLSSALVATGSPSALGTVALASTSGRLRLGLVALGVAGLAVASRGRWVRRGVVAAALVAEAGSGHAASSPLPLVAVPSFAVHLAAVGVWSFAVLAAVLSRERLRSVLASFTPVAVGAAGVVGATGVLNAGVELEHLSDLTGTGYGKAVLAKGAVFLGVAAFGLLHHLGRKRPGVGLDTLALPVRGELVALAGALAVATALVGFPNPPADAAAQERATRVDPVLAALEGREAVSLAEASGRFTVALSLLPPEPGRIEARVQLLGTEPGDGVRDGRLSATSRAGAGSRARTALETCETGFGCYRGRLRADAEGTWRFDVDFASNVGPIEASFEVPLPTPDGTAEFERMREAMRSLDSARVREDLSDRTDGPVIVSHYTFDAPERMRWAVEGGSTKVAVGGTGYSRSDDADSWDRYEWPEPGFSWPTGFYDSFFAVSTTHRIVGTEVLDGVETRVLAFAQPEFKAWYRLWVGVDDGLVRRLEMRAERHIMDQTYGGFDEDVTVEAPL